MKKRGILVMTVLVVMAMLFASCSSNLSEGDTTGGSSSKVVSVSLGVDVEGEAIQKAISTNTDLSNLTFWYKATPKWTQPYPIHGGTGDFVQIPDCTAGNKVTLGNFTAGTWLFEVEVRKGSSVVYSGNTIKSIYTGGVDDANSTVVIVVTPDADDDGYVTITVKVPTTGNGEKLYVDYAGPESDTVELTTRIDPGVDPLVPETYNLAEFRGTINDLTPGAYTFAFRYKDAAGTQLNTGAAIAVNVFAEQESTITGLVDGKHWIFSSIIIKMPGFSAFTVTPDVVPPATTLKKAPTGTIAFAASATTISGNDAKFEWFVNETSQGAASTSNTAFNFTEANPGLYVVTCVASDGNTPATAATSSITRVIEVGYSTIEFGSMTNGDVSLTNPEGTIYAVGDLVPLTIEPDPGYHITGLTVTGVTAGNIAFDAASNTGSFRMPAAASVTVTATFAADAP